MITECPRCKTRFEITTEEVATGNGKIHCTHCYNSYTVTLIPATEEPALSTVTAAELLELESDLIQQKTISAPGSFGTIAWTTAILLAALVLAAQYTYFMRDRLAQHPTLRPWLEQLCQVANCELALQRNPSRITITSRNIRSHPAFKNALLIDITLRNEAPFTQAYPGLTLSFLDINGSTLAMRHFQPEEYLPESIKIQRGLAPMTPTKISMEIVDPDNKAINYQFDFF